MSKLTISNHTRNFEQNKYIYPVLSRRANGLSIGVNLNTNNACNWRCIYCQVENLTRGEPEPIDLIQLENELDHMLNEVINGDFLAQYVGGELPLFNDISLSGNGEPTQSSQFLQVTKIIQKLRNKYNLTRQVKTVLITNGSQLNREDVQVGILEIAENNGEVWFKVDRGDKLSIGLINQVNLSMDAIFKKIITSCTLCKTYIQTCMFRFEETDPTPEEIDAYVDFMISLRQYISGVLLYSVARKPALPEGDKISSVSLEFLQDLASKLEQNGVKASYYL